MGSERLLHEESSAASEATLSQEKSERATTTQTKTACDEDYLRLFVFDTEKDKFSDFSTQEENGGQSFISLQSCVLSDTLLHSPQRCHRFLQ